MEAATKCPWRISHYYTVEETSTNSTGHIEWLTPPIVRGVGRSEDKNSEKRELDELNQARRELLSYSSYSHVDC